MSFGLIDGPWCEVNGFGLVYPALEVDADDPGKVMYGALVEEVLADFSIKKIKFNTRFDQRIGNWSEKSWAEKVRALKDFYGEFKTGAALETSQDFVPHDRLFLICTGKNTRRPQRLLAEDNLFVFLNELHLRDE